MDRDIRNVLIRDLTDEDRCMIKEVMRDTGVGSASKALIRAGHSFCRQSKVIERLRDRNRELEAENIALRRGAREIARGLERIQGVLLSE